MPSCGPGALQATPASAAPAPGLRPSLAVASLWGAGRGFPPGPLRTRPAPGWTPRWACVHLAESSRRARPRASQPGVRTGVAASRPRPPRFAFGGLRDLRGCVCLITGCSPHG